MPQRWNRAPCCRCVFRLIAAQSVTALALDGTVFDADSQVPVAAAILTSATEVAQSGPDGRFHFLENTQTGRVRYNPKVEKIASGDTQTSSGFGRFSDWFSGLSVYAFFDANQLYAPALIDERRRQSGAHKVVGFGIARRGPSI